MVFDKGLREIYYDESGRFKGVSRLWNEVRGKDGFFGIKFREVKAFVEKQGSYQETKQFRAPGQKGKKGKRNLKNDKDRGNGYTTVRAPRPGTNLQIDLMFFNPKERIGNVKYEGVMNVVDVHSRKAWSLPFKTKQAPEMKGLFKSIIKEIESSKGKGAVKHLNQDDGSEFKGAFKQFVDKKKIKQHISAREDFAKNPIVERFNRTVREIMEKYELDYPGEQILAQWQTIVVGPYNSTYHTTIKNKPNSVWKGKKKNRQKYYDVDYDFQKGDKVRVIRKKTLVEKGKYAWRPGVYTIHKKKKRGYILKDKNGVKQLRRYMGYEMQAIDKDVQRSDQYTEVKAAKAQKAKTKAMTKKKQKKFLKADGIQKQSVIKTRRKTLIKKDEYVVNKILERRKKSGRYEYLVKWKGYNDKTWEPRSSFQGGAQEWYRNFDKQIV